MIEGAGLEFMAPWAARNTPYVVAVLAHDATSMVAPGAAALDHSASRIASSSSEFTPGDSQPPGCTAVRAPVEYCESPKVLRKVVQSDVLYRFVSSTTIIV